jgi:hypothetical protein
MVQPKAALIPGAAGAGRSSKRLALLLLWAALVCVPAKGAQEMIDQIITIVNEDIITRTDLLWSIALDPRAPAPNGPLGADLLRQKLDTMIDQRLIAQEAARMPAADITTEELNKARVDLIQSFGSEDAFRRRVESVGLTSPRIDRLLRERILINKFVDFRFQSFVFVSEKEIQTYYDQRLIPEITKGGRVAPPLAKVRDEITEILKREKINEEIDRFLREARQRANIIQLVEL